MDVIIYAFDHDEHEIFRGLHAKYGTLAVSVAIIETLTREGVDYYKISTRIKGKKECTATKRFTEFAEFNERLQAATAENSENENLAALQSSFPSKHENSLALFAGSKEKAIQSEWPSGLTMCTRRSHVLPVAASRAPRGFGGLPAAGNVQSTAQPRPPCVKLPER